MNIQGMTYGRKRLLEAQLSLWKDLKRDYMRDRDAEIEASKEWHSYNNIITDLNIKIKHAEIAYREVR